MVEADGLSENEVPTIPPDVFAKLPDLRKYA